MTLLQKYDKTLKGYKTYALIAAFAALAIYGHSQGLEFDSIAEAINSLTTILTNQFNQGVVLLAAWKAFNRASQDSA